jgi:hypothetical protein
MSESGWEADSRAFWNISREKPRWTLGSLQHQTASHLAESPAWWVIFFNQTGTYLEDEFRSSTAGVGCIERLRHADDGHCDE